MGAESFERSEGSMNLSRKCRHVEPYAFAGKSFEKSFFALKRSNDFMCS